MRTNVNKEELKREWILNHWYEKAIYIIGFLWTAFMALAFITGLVQGIATW